MKTALLLGLLSISALADEYLCPVRLLKMELSLNEMTTLTVQDTQTNEFIYNGVASEVMTSGNTTDLMFETQPHNYLQLRFKSSDLNDRPEKIMGLVRGFSGRGFLDQSMTCVKKL